jgi:hypothetical protein
MSKYNDEIIINDDNDDEIYGSKKYRQFDDEFENEDYMLALQLQMQMDEDDESSNDSKKEKVDNYAIKSYTNSDIDMLDPQWELIDPSPDIRAMFQEFDKKYFWNSLGSCIVEWR